MTALRRQDLGLTQRSIAQGGMTQSLISQVEAGRVVPTRPFLQRMAPWLQVEPEFVCKLWDGWGERHIVRAHLWAAGLALNAERIQKLLTKHGNLLVSFERDVYLALYKACHCAYGEANLLLFQAWSKDTAAQSGLAYGYKVRGGTGSGQIYPRSQSWTAVDFARALVADANTREVINRGIHRREAADYWCHKANERMKDTV